MSSPVRDPAEPRSFVAVWGATLLIIMVFVLGLLIFPPLYETPEVGPSRVVLFLGRFHPILLHLPIGALSLLCLFELICSTQRGEHKYGSMALLTLLIGSAGAVLASLVGIMLSREGGYVGGNFTLHQTMAILGTAGVLVALVVRIMAMSRHSTELLNAYRALYFLSFAVMSLGAHFGGNMSHGSRFLTEHAPSFIKFKMISMEKWMLSLVEQPKLEAEEPQAPANPPPTPENPPPTLVAAPTELANDEKLVFQHVILPILDAKCNKCHSEEKSKGDLRMDTYELAMKGGEDGNSFVAGKPAESLGLTRIMLPDSDDDHMPPEGKDQMTAEETALLKWWIEQGASNTQRVNDAPFSDELKAAAEDIMKG